MICAIPASPDGSLLIIISYPPAQIVEMAYSPEKKVKRKDFLKGNEIHLL